MRRVKLSAISPRRPVFWLLLALAAPGCHHAEENNYTSVSEPPTVQLIQPQVRNLVRVVGQPSFIEAYERTSIFPKLAGYIQEWKVDIGDKVKKDQVLATLFIPELVEEHGTKGATVVLDKERIDLAKKVVEVAGADVKAARGAGRGGEGRGREIQGRCRSLGLGSQAAPTRGRRGRGRPPGPARVGQSAQGEHRVLGRVRRRPC